jgi:hypothetical protein
MRFALTLSPSPKRGVPLGEGRQTSFMKVLLPGVLAVRERDLG